jgi:hypothetical protein
MSASTPHKLQESVDLCKADLEKMQKAQSPEAVCGEVAGYIKGADDPFGAGGEAGNPWLQAPPGGGGCCDVQ